MKINLTNYGIDRMIKITVLGGSGFLGSHLCELLSEKNFIVTIFDKNKSRYKNKKAFYDEAVKAFPNVVLSYDGAEII